MKTSRIIVDKMLCLPYRYWLILVQLPFSSVLLHTQTYWVTQANSRIFFFNQKFSLSPIKHHSCLRFAIRKASNDLVF